MNIINLDKLFHLYERRKFINSLDIAKIIVFDNGYTKFSDVFLDDMLYSGIGNHNIIELSWLELKNYTGTLEGFYIIELSEIAVMKYYFATINSYDLLETAFIKDCKLFNISPKVVNSYKEIGLSNLGFFTDGYYLLEESELPQWVEVK